MKITIAFGDFLFLDDLKSIEAATEDVILII